MGLDWNPLGKPKKGMEEEFYRLLGQLSLAKDWVQPAGFSFEKVSKSRQDALRERFFAIQVSPNETLDAPRVGRDADAEAWIRSQYDDAPHKPPTIEEWVSQFNGYYVLELLPPSDGLPVYSNEALGSYWQRWSFRAQFFVDCEDVLGEALFGEAWLHHLPDQLADFGERLMACAREYARIHNVSHILNARWFSKEEEERGEDRTHPLHKAHIVASAARWAAFWSSRGHGLHADY